MDDLKEKCTELKSKGYANYEIANKLGITPTEVFNLVGNTYHRVTKDDLKLIKELRNKNVPVSEIAKIIGVHSNTIWNNLKITSISFDSKPYKENKISWFNKIRLKRMYKRGASISSIVKKFNINHNTVFEILGMEPPVKKTAEGYKIAYGKITNSELNKIEIMYKQGVKVEEIARLLGRSKSAIYNNINKYNFKIDK